MKPRLISSFHVLLLLLLFSYSTTNGGSATNAERYMDSDRLPARGPSCCAAIFSHDSTANMSAFLALVVDYYAAGDMAPEKTVEDGEWLCIGHTGTSPEQTYEGKETHHEKHDAGPDEGMKLDELSFSELEDRVVGLPKSRSEHRKYRAEACGSNQVGTPERRPDDVRGPQHTSFGFPRARYGMPERKARIAPPVVTREQVTVGDHDEYLKTQTRKVDGEASASLESIHQLYKNSRRTPRPSALPAPRAGRLLRSDHERASPY
ncbi:hypothetical protein F5Y10DRAFT_121757 [Nemania abortiva]|nr:hypothetical protein F5Y10DRAFT_121757 [Nemania abortiva]